MLETTASVRRDIEETRARVTRTLAELQDEVGSRRAAVAGKVAAVRDGVSHSVDRAQDGVVQFAQEHPWYALAAAVGVGVLLGRSGADAALARGAVAGTKSAASSAAGATANAARAGVAKAKRLVHRDGDSASGAGIHATSHAPETGAIGSSAEDTGEVDVAEETGIVYRLRTGVVEALGVDELLDSMRREANRIGR